MRLTLDAHSLEVIDRERFREEQDRKRSERTRRVRALSLDRARLQQYINQHSASDRKQAIKSGFLKKNAPPRGGEMISARFRAEQESTLLEEARDGLFGLLFGNSKTKTRLRRVRRELLTLTLSRSKADALSFMNAATELSARGTWQDSEGGARDVKADNIVLEVEFGELTDGLIGQAVAVALRLINNLQIYEEILYGCIEHVEQSTLIT